jgi:transcriptional regulator
MRNILSRMQRQNQPRGPAACVLAKHRIAQRIQQMSQDVLRVWQGSLYPALHRLEVQRLIASEMGTSENNRRARFYRLTAAGRRRLGAETENWERLSMAVARILRTA